MPCTHHVRGACPGHVREQALGRDHADHVLSVPCRPRPVCTVQHARVCTMQRPCPGRPLSLQRRPQRTEPRAASLGLRRRSTPPGRRLRPAAGQGSVHAGTAPTACTAAPCGRAAGRRRRRASSACTPRRRARSGSRAVARGPGRQRRPRRGCGPPLRLRLSASASPPPPPPLPPLWPASPPRAATAAAASHHASGTARVHSALERSPSGASPLQGVSTARVHPATPGRRSGPG
jgi:hypothetical protein